PLIGRPAWSRSRVPARFLERRARPFELRFQGDQRVSDVGHQGLVHFQEAPRAIGNLSGEFLFASFETGNDSETTVSPGRTHFETDSFFERANPFRRKEIVFEQPNYCGFELRARNRNLAASFRLHAARADVPRIGVPARSGAKALHAHSGRPV